MIRPVQEKQPMRFVGIEASYDRSYSPLGIQDMATSDMTLDNANQP